MIYLSNYVSENKCHKKILIKFYTNLIHNKVEELQLINCSMFYKLLIPDGGSDLV